MKKLFLLVVAATLLASCGSQAKFTKSSTHTKISVATPITAVMADLEVSTKKISHILIPSKTVRKGGFDNIVNTAVQEALEANDNADVLVGLEKQVKYNDKGEVETIVVTGYPAKYVNFRSPGDDYLLEISKGQSSNNNNYSNKFKFLKFK